MLDYISIETSNIEQCQAIRNNAGYEGLYEKPNKQTGAVGIIEKYKYYGVTLNVYLKDEIPAKATFSGSLHYLSNGGLHNANDFTYTSLIQVINRLKIDLKIDPVLWNVKAAEHGINFIPKPYDTNMVITKLFYWKTLPFYMPNGRSMDKRAGSNRRNDMSMKVYNKSSHIPEYAQNNVLRIESRFNNARSLNKIDVYNLNDLIQKKTLLRLCNILHTNITNFVLFDFTIDQIKLSNIEKKNVDLLRYMENWDEVKTQHRGKFRRKVKTLNTLSEEKGTNIRIKLASMAVNKGIDMLGLSTFRVVKASKNRDNTCVLRKEYTPKSGAYTCRFNSEDNPKSGAYTCVLRKEYTPKNRDNTCRSNDRDTRGKYCTPQTWNLGQLTLSKWNDLQQPSKTKSDAYTCISIVGICTTKQFERQGESGSNAKATDSLSISRKCLITKLDIDMQRNDSFILHEKGVKWYYHNNKKVYRELEKRFLGSHSGSLGIEKKANNIAHNIRNQVYVK